jgi:hypothetical protein
MGEEHPLQVYFSFSLGMLELLWNTSIRLKSGDLSLMLFTPGIGCKMYKNHSSWWGRRCKISHQCQTNCKVCRRTRPTSCTYWYRRGNACRVCQYTRKIKIDLMSLTCKLYTDFFFHVELIAQNTKFKFPCPQKLILLSLWCKLKKNQMSLIAMLEVVKNR